LNKTDVGGLLLWLCHDPMSDYKILVGYLAIVVAIISYVPYFRGIFANRVKPHAFSWLVWSVLTGIAFAAQVTKQGGAGAWVTGFTALISFVLFLLALIKGDRRFATADWLSLASAFAALILWQSTNDPTLSVILVTITDALGFLPTVRKGHHKPHEDSRMLWSITAVKWALAIIALESYSLVTLLYPAYLLITNALYPMYLTWRQHK
jgi:hypothetical protein